MKPKFPLDADVTRVLGEQPPSLREIAQALRMLVRRSAPELREVLKWSNPVWVGNGNVICLMLYEHHVNLGFFRGAEMVSRFSIIEGTGKGLRHVKVHSLAEARRPVLPRIVREAVRRDVPPR